MSGLVTVGGTDNGIIHDKRPLRSKVFAYHHEDTESDGNVSFTGCGFRPAAGLFFGANQQFSGFGGNFGPGMACAENNASATYTIRPQNYSAGGTEWMRYEADNFSTYANSTPVVYRATMGNTNGFLVGVTSWDADGITLYFDKFYTGTANMEIGFVLFA